MTTELMKPAPTPYLTVIPGRRPEQKVHTSINAAKNAFGPGRRNDNLRSPHGGRYYSLNTHGWGQLYQMVDGEWELLYDVPQPDVPTDSYPYYEDTRPWRING